MAEAEPIFFDGNADVVSMRARYAHCGAYCVESGQQRLGNIFGAWPGGLSMIASDGTLLSQNYS